MACTVRIDGCLPEPGAGSTKGIVFARGWAVEYDWAADRAAQSNQPARLLSRNFPHGFAGDLEGALRGQGRFAEFLYLFSLGQYVRLRETPMIPDGPPTGAAGPWSLPTNWTSFDAVFPGSGIRSGFSYFVRGHEYSRFDWSTDRLSPGYPKIMSQEWHTPPSFARGIDGVIVGQAAFSTKMYIFKTLGAVVDRNGNGVPVGTPGSIPVSVPGYARYDFNAQATESTVVDPVAVVSAWNGLLPLLDAGAAIDTALGWCNAAVASLGTVPPPTALQHHFRTASPTSAQLTTLRTQMTAIRDRLNSIPASFKWTAGLAFPAQTSPGTLTEIGDEFSTFHGPNGRAAVLIHEAAHFTFPGGGGVDIPEWSGETINGVPIGVDPLSGRAYSSMTTDEALSNPSSYAAFAQEVALGADTRFGAGRPHQ